MENGEVIETKYRRHVRIPLVAWVFGAGNATSSLPAPLKSRFGRPLRFKAYTPEEFVDVAAQVLVVRESLPETFARAVAAATLELGSRDVREAIRLARLAGNDDGLKAVVETLRRRR